MLLEFIQKFLFILSGKGYGGVHSVKNEVRTIMKIIESPILIFDIGANKGYNTEALLLQNKNAKIYCFEPSNSNIETLNSKFSMLKNVYIINYALSNYSGEAELYFDTPGSGLGSLTKRDLSFLNINFESSQKIQVTTFKKFYQTNFPNNTIIDIVKIDVEGHEMNVLYGMKEVINKIKTIQFEFGGCNLDTHTTFKDFWHFFTKNKFSIYRITPLGLLRISKYSELDEIYKTTNYICINTNFLDNY